MTSRNKNRSRSNRNNEMHVYLSIGGGKFRQLDIVDGLVAEDGIKTADKAALDDLNAGIGSSGKLTAGVYGNFVVASDLEKAGNIWKNRPVGDRNSGKASSSSGSGASSSSGGGASGDGGDGGSGGGGDEDEGDEDRSDNEADDNDNEDDAKRSNGNNEKDGKGMTKAPVSVEQMRKLTVSVISFAAANTSVGLANMRAAVKAYGKYAGVKNEHVAALMSLGLSAVGSVKRIWAVDMLQAMKGLGTVPGIFVGAGGTYKAFLYMGYDILMHMAEEKDSSNWPEWLKISWDNCDRVCPGGRITKSRHLDEDVKESNKNRNAAVDSAKDVFKGWEADPSLNYVTHLCSIKDSVTASGTKGVITKFVPIKNAPAKRNK